MPKKRKPGRPPKSANGAQLQEVLDVFGRAEQLYPQLQAQRDRLASELAKVEEALSRLGPVAGKLSTAAPAPKARVASATVTVTKPKGRPGRKPGGGATLSTLLLDVLGRAKAPLGASDLTKLVQKENPGAGVAGMQKVLKDLRDRGQIKATGKAKRFQYTLGKGGAPVAAAPAKKTKGAAKSAPAKRGPKPGGGPSVREILVSALDGGKALSMNELVGAATGKRDDIKKASVETIVHKLRRDGVLKAGGESGATKFSLA